MTNITTSNHTLLVANIITEIGLCSISKAKSKRAKSGRISFDLENTKPKDWTNYCQYLDKELSKKWATMNDVSTSESMSVREKLDQKWGIIKESITVAAKKCLPKKRRKKAIIQSTLSLELREARKKIRIISKLCRKCKRNYNRLIESSDVDMINKLLNIDESKASMIEDHIVWTEKLYKRLTDFWRSESKI